ncbi:MAG TPA: hypothetical protein P5566_12150, partial [Spirochaetota bacterium]|nr:hypothetical protein [Spirochaetota bacterium]
ADKISAGFFIYLDRYFPFERFTPTISAHILIQIKILAINNFIGIFAIYIFLFYIDDKHRGG